MTLMDAAELARAGAQMIEFVRSQMRVPRSLTGQGVRDTLAAIKAQVPGLEVHEVPTGTQVLDWTIPDEWTVRSARLAGPDGTVVADFDAHRLHLVGYSEPVDIELTLEQLQPHLYSLPDQPDAIPYVTSYYGRRWGFCLTDRERQALRPGLYRAVIDADLKPGHLNYGELLLPGRSEREILISTYVCHPEMANNELSGPAVATWLARRIAARPDRRYSYRFVFIPETIGSISYISRNLDAMKQRTVAGFNITCVGDDRCYSYLPSRAGDTLSDRAAKHALKHLVGDYKTYSYLQRGSDERQYCAPGVDLPVASIMRSKYGEYPEYHTSLDNLDVVTETGLAGALRVIAAAVALIEHNDHWRTTVLGEPQLGKRGLYPTISTVGSAAEVRTMVDFLGYADGQRDLIDLAEAIGVSAFDCLGFIEKLAGHDLIRRDLQTDTDGARRHV